MNIILSVALICSNSAGHIMTIQIHVCIFIKCNFSEEKFKQDLILSNKLTDTK